MLNVSDVQFDEPQDAAPPPQKPLKMSDVTFDDEPALKQKPIKVSGVQFDDTAPSAPKSQNPYARPDNTFDIDAFNRAKGQMPDQQKFTQPLPKPTDFSNLLPTAEDKFNQATGPIRATNLEEQGAITAHNAVTLKGAKQEMPGVALATFNPTTVTFENNKPGDLRNALYQKLGIADVAKELKEQHGADLLSFPVKDAKTGETRPATDEEMARYAQQSQSASVGGRDVFGATVPISPATLIAASAYKTGGIEAYKKAVELLQQQKDNADKQIKDITPEERAMRQRVGENAQLVAGANEAAIKNMQIMHNLAGLIGLNKLNEIVGGVTGYDPSQEFANAQAQFERQGSTPAMRSLPNPETFKESLNRQLPGMAADFSRMAVEGSGLGPAAALTIPADVAIQNLNKPIHEQLKAQWQNLPMTAASLIPGGPMAKSLALGPTAAAQTLYEGGSNQQALSQAALMSLLPVLHGGESEEVGNKIIDGFGNAKLQRALLDYVQRPTAETSDLIDQHLGEMGLDAKQSQEFLNNLRTRINPQPEPVSAADQLAAEKKSASAGGAVTVGPTTEQSTTTPESLKSTQQGVENASEIRRDQTTVDQQGNVNEGGRAESGTDLQRGKEAGASAGDTQQRQEGQVTTDQRVSQVPREGQPERRQTRTAEPAEVYEGQIVNYRNQNYRVNSVDDQFVRATDLSGKEGMRLFKREDFDKITQPPADTRDFTSPEEAAANRARAQGSKPAAESPTEPPKSASVKAFITKADEAALKARGYSDDNIYKMKPADAQKILETPAAPKTEEVKPNEQTTATVPATSDTGIDRETRNVSDALNDDNHPLSQALDRVAAGDTSDEAINAVRAAGADFDKQSIDDLIDGATRLAKKQPTENPEPLPRETTTAQEGVEPPRPPEFEKTTKLPTAADKVNENDHFNFKRSQFSSAESEQAFRKLVRETVAENGTAHKTRVTREDHINRVNEIDPDLAKEAIKNYKPGDPVPSREVFHAAVEYSQNNMREAMETRKFINEAGDQLDPAQKAKLEAHADQLEFDAKEVMGGAIGVRSEFGRNLALLAATKMDKDSVAYQVRRADAAAKARGDDLTSKDWQIQRGRIADLGVKLEQATMRVNDLLRQLSQSGKRRAPKEESATLSKFIRDLGGFKSDKDLQGEINRLRSKESGTTGMFGKKGLSPDSMRERAEEAGYLKEGSTPSDLFDALERDLRGDKVYSTQRDQNLYDKELQADYKKAHPEEFQTWQERFTSKLDKMEQDARARLSQTFNPNQLNDITVMVGRSADLAIIMASKIAKKLISLTEIRKQMTDEFGDHFAQDQDRIERAALEVHDDQRLEALTEAAKVPNKEVRKTALTELKGEVAKRDQAERKATKEAEDVKKNQVKFNAESRLEAAKNADAAERKAVAAEARAKAIEARDEQRYQQTVEARSIRADQFEKQQQERAKSQELGAAETDAAEARRQADKFNAESKQQQARAEEVFRKQKDAADARDAATKARKAQREAELNEQKAIRTEAARQKTQAAKDANPVYQLGVEGKATEVRLQQPGETATPEDLAKIGAAKLHEPGMTSAKWTAEMQQYGKTFTDNQRVVREQSAKLSGDAKDQVKEQQQKQTAAASDAYRAAIKQGKSDTEARAAAREARANTGALTEEQVASLKDQYTKAKADQSAARRELAQNFANLEQSKLEKASTAFKAGLISSVRTLAKIVISHSSFMGMEAASKIPSSIVDMAASALSGNDRQVGGLSVEQLRQAATKAVQRGLPDAYQKLKTGYFPEGEDIYSKVQGTSNPLETREFHSNSRLLNLWVNGIMRSHGAVYSIHRVMGAAMALREQAELGARYEAKKAVADGKLQPGDVAAYRKMRAEQLFNNPTDTMTAHAIHAAEEMAFVNESKSAQAMKGVKSGLVKVLGGGAVGKFAADRLLPFARVPANVAARTAEYAGGSLYAPARLAFDAITNKMAGEKLITPEAQARFSKTFGRGMVGAGLMAAGYILAANGKATGYIQGYDDKAALKIGGRTWHTGLIPPVGTLLAVGATIYELTHFPMDTSGGVGAKTYGNAVFKSAIEAGSEQPLIREVVNISDIMESKDKVHGLKKFLGGIAGQPIPTLVSDAAAQIDRTKRQKDSINSYVRERIPFVRQTLPASTFPGREPNKLFDPFASIPTNPANATPGIRLKEFKPGR